MTHATRLLTAIRRGHITSGSQASARFGISPATLWRAVAELRRSGIQIATSTGGKWRVLNGEGK